MNRNLINYNALLLLCRKVNHGILLFDPFGQDLLPTVDNQWSFNNIDDKSPSKVTGICLGTCNIFFITSWGTTLYILKYPVKSLDTVKASLEGNFRDRPIGVT